MEISFSIAMSKCSILEEFANNIDDKLQVLDVYSFCYTLEERRIVVVHFPKRIESFIYCVLREELVELITCKLKYDYLKRRLTKVTCDQTLFELLLITLVSFDREKEIATTKKLLKITDDFAVDAFFNFKLVELQHNWQEIIEMTNSNAYILTCKDAYTELFDFLISTVISKEDTVKIVLADERYYILTSNNICVSAKSEGAFLHQLIEIAPKNIMLENDNTCNLTVEKLNLLFSARISTSYV